MTLLITTNKHLNLLLLCLSRSHTQTEVRSTLTGSHSNTPVYFMRQASVGTEHVFKFATGVLGLASVGVIISWFLLYRIGRRTLYVWASGMLNVLLLLVGITATVCESQGASFAQAGLLTL